MPGYTWSDEEKITHTLLNDQNVRVADGVLIDGGQNALIFSWQNTVVSGDILVWLILVSITTPSAAAAQINCGQNAAEATSDNMIDGALLNAAHTRNSIIDAGANGEGAVYVADDEWVTGWEDNTANTANLVGKFYIFYTTI